jgi:tetratricopeptide (TPR) repeat protein
MMSVLQTPKEHPFLALNQQVFAELLTFIDFAEGLTIGFIEVNFAADGDVLIEALKEHPAHQGSIRFEVINVSQRPDLRFLKDELVQRLSKLATVADQKRVVIVRGLEVAIGTDGVGAYPPVLQDLNFVRDAYRASVPYPLLFVLPDYAITRIAKYAPDFWAWRSGVFVFKTLEQTREALRLVAMDAPHQRMASTQNQEQIEQLKLLLMEYHPSGQPIMPENQAICADLYYKLGSAYLTQRQAIKAKDYLIEALKLAQQKNDLTLEQSIQQQLGKAYTQSRQFENAIAAYRNSQKLAEKMGNQSQVSAAFFYLGNVALEQRQFQKARQYYQQSLEIDKAQNDDYYSQASIYNNLGIVAQDLREYEEARRNYQQALDIYIEYGDRYSQAKIYFCLGSLAATEEKLPEVRANFEQALERYQEFGDEYWTNKVQNQIQNLGD